MVAWCRLGLLLGVIFCPCFLTDGRGRGGVARLWVWLCSGLFSSIAAVAAGGRLGPAIPGAWRALEVVVDFGGC